MKNLRIMIVAAAFFSLLAALPNPVFAQDSRESSKPENEVTSVEPDDELEEGMSDFGAGTLGLILGGLGGGLGGGILGAAYASGPYCTSDMCGLAIIPYGLLGAIAGLPIGAVAGVSLNSERDQTLGGVLIGASLGGVIGGSVMFYTENALLGAGVLFTGILGGGWLGYELTDVDTTVSVSPTDGGAAFTLRTSW